MDEQPTFPSDLVGVSRPAVGAVTLPAAEPDHRRPYAQTVVHAAVPIPDGKPDEVATALAAQRHPTGDAVTQRLAQIARDIPQAIEDCRLHHADSNQGLVSFTQRIGSLLSEQRRLRIKNGLEPGEPADSEATRIVLSIQRWSDGDAVRAHRAKTVAMLTAEIRQADSSLQSCMAPGHSTGGPLVNEAALKQRAEALLTHKGQLEKRLALINAGGDGKRAALMANAVTAAGGLKAVAAKIAPLLAAAPGRSGSEALNAQIAQVTQGLSSVDGATQRAQGLRDELARLQTQLRQITSADAFDRSKRAQELVRGCSDGSLDALAQVQQHAAIVSAPFESAVREACGSGSDLTATIAEIIAAHQLELVAIADRKEAQRVKMAGK